jgi:DNA-binding MarR family transcriptional regulator
MPSSIRTPSTLLEPRALDELLLYRLMRLQATAGALVVRYCEGQYGITRREWRIIAVLAAKGPMGSSELAEHAHLDRSRTSKAVTALAQKNLLSRTIGLGDARYIRLALTATGLATHRSLFPLVSQINRDVLAGLNSHEVGLFDDILARLQQSAEALSAKSTAPLADRRRGGSARLNQRTPNSISKSLL